MLRSLDVSASAMTVLQTKMDVVSNNLANANTIADAQGRYSPYRRKQVLFAPGNAATGSSFGVHLAGVMEDRKSPLRAAYEPDNEFADAKGNVYYPNVDPLTEMTDALVTVRAYQANATAFDATKSMVTSALRLLA